MFYQMEFYFKFIRIWKHDSFRDERCLELGWDCYCDQPINVSRRPLQTTTDICIEFMSGYIKQTGGEGYEKKVFQINLNKPGIDKNIATYLNCFKGNF